MRSTRLRLAAKRDQTTLKYRELPEIKHLETERIAPSADRAAKPSSLGDLAKRITSRTTDLLAVSIVLVASLTLGRQILHWWHAAPPPTTVAIDPALPAPAWEGELQPLSLEFGDMPLALTRQVVMGDQKAAVEALVRHCQAVAEGAECPAGEPNDAEQRLLEKIAGLTAVEKPVEKPDAEKSGGEKSQDWQVYVVDERFTLVAAVRRFSDSGAGVTPADGQAGRLQHNDEDGQAGRLHHKSGHHHGSKETARGVIRLVCWGIAMPAGEKAWTLYVFRESPTGIKSPSGLPNVPLPPGALRNLSLRDERGGLLLGFSGSGSAQNWMKFYDDWFAGQGWSQTDNWSTGAEAWSTKFSNPKRPQAGRVEIRFAGNRHGDRHGDLTGLLQMIPQDTSE